MKKYLTAVFLILFMATAYGQVGGNQIYQNNNRNNNYSYSPPQRVNIISTDSTLILGANVLLNKKADYYLITIGVKEEAKTVVECDKNITTRIKAFVSDLKKLGIQKDNIYTDFISQTKIYDHKIEASVITEFLDGFEIKKNLIIKVKELELIDKINMLASKQEIYDLVKVEYFNSDIEKIYDDLFDEVVKVIERKKARFSKYSSVKFSNQYRVIQDDFRIYNPKDLYKHYNEAFASSIVSTHYTRSYIKKEVRKDKTFYYDGVQNNAGFDKIIDNVSPIVGIQYSLKVSIFYKLKKE